MWRFPLPRSGKSFRFYIFLNVFLVTALIIFANRLIAQYFLTIQITQNVEVQLVEDMSRCADHLHNRDSFLVCLINGSNKQDIVQLTRNSYVLCPAADRHTSATQPTSCKAIQATENNVLMSASGPALERVKAEEQEWYVVRDRSDSKAGFLMMLTSKVDDLMEHFWSLRDRNLLLTLPFVLLSLLLMTLYLTGVFLRQVQALKKSLAVLEPEDLNKSAKLQSRFNEFDDFIQIFETLRLRLQQSFTKARRFASDASHELRTPLTILRGNAEQMISELPTGSETQIRMRVISDQVDRLIDISAKLLLLSQADANSIKVHLDELDMSQLVWNWVQDAKTFNDHVEIKHSIEPRLQCNGDRQLLLQLIQNLYTNAINYNIENGWLRISLNRDSQGLILKFENPTNHACQDFSERAFYRFYRGSDSLARGIEGHGLGLSICQEIAKVHGGLVTGEIINNIVCMTVTLPQST
jgi:signal transduction histidine kinase